MKLRIAAVILAAVLLLPLLSFTALADTAESLAAAESQAAARDDIPDFRPDDADRGAGRIAAFSAGVLLCGGGLAAVIILLVRGKKK